MKIGIVGATGLVGRTILQIMQEKSISPAMLRLFSSGRSAGNLIRYNDTDLVVEEFTPRILREGFDYLLFSAGKEIALQIAPAAELAGITVIDNSSGFRLTRPLIVPEINGDLIKAYQGIIANPNCSTIQLVLALYPLDQLYRLKKLVISTYQSVSGAGKSYLDTLMKERASAIPSSKEYLPIDLNVIPKIGDIGDDNYCEEENKMRFEIKKILSNDKVEIAVTTVRVPVLYGHSESVYAEFEKDVDLAEIESLWQKSRRIEFAGNRPITPREVEGSDLSYVCRLRKGVCSKSIVFWNAADNIRVGAATNAFNILADLIETRANKQ